MARFRRVLLHSTSAYKVRPKQSLRGVRILEIREENNFAPVTVCVPEQERDKAGDEAMAILHQPSNKNYQGRPISGCG